jgi:hypothetical protein
VQITTDEELHRYNKPVMFKTILITSLLMIAAHSLKAQYSKYEPLPLPPAQGSADYNVPPSYRNAPSGRGESQRVSGYIINVSTQSIRKIILQVAVYDRSIAITGVKELQDTRWTTFSVNKPVAEKLSYNEAFSKQFEYKVYIPVLG